MPVVTINNVDIFYRLDGSSSNPPLLFSNSLGTDHAMWDAQVSELVKKFYLIRYDTRGHGRSMAPTGPYLIDDLSKDVIGLLDYLNIPKVNFCGLSMGGVIGQWFGINHPDRLVKLVLSNTAPKIGTPDTWIQRAKLVRDSGMSQVAESAPSRWFTQSFVKENYPAVERLVSMLKDSNPEGYASCCEALSKSDLIDKIRLIEVPTLIIAGSNDPVTTVPDGIFMSKMIPNSQLYQINASHISNVEAAEEFTEKLLNFLI
jgi:3-oxoadipate enol-lactonase